MNVDLKIPESGWNALFEGEPSFKQVMHKIKQVVWILDLRNDRILYVSPAFEDIWGRSCESFYSDPFILIESVHPEDRVKVLSANLDDSKPVDQSYRILRPDGSQRWVSTHSFGIGEEGKDASYQISIAQDITDQKEVDHTLRRALDRSREQFAFSRRMSLARKPETVLKTLMFASELRNAKRAFILFFDSPKEAPFHGAEVIASWSVNVYPTRSEPIDTASEINLIDDLALLDIFHPSKAVVVTEVLKDQRLSPEVKAQLLDGNIQSVATFPLVALGNWLGCLLVFFTQVKYLDPVELRQIKVLVDQASITLYNLQLLEIEAESRREAQRANEIKTRFLAMISHELRTPLTSIIGFTTTLLADDVTWEPAEQRDFIQTIRQEADRLQELIDHLLDLSRLEAGVLPIVLAPHSFQDIVNDALPQFRVMTQRHNFSVRLPANLPLVQVDSKRIAQVLVNLVRNAATYAPEGTDISLSASVRHQYLQINVNDQGPGIPAMEHKRVFRAFERGNSVENSAAKGAGLGLAICKGLVEAHKGRIWIKKKTIRGTTVSFTIPLVPIEVPAEPTKGEG